MKIAVVVGASRGIGKGIALQLSKSHHIILLGKTISSEKYGGLEQVKQEILLLGYSAEYVQCNVVDLESIQNAFQNIESRLGIIHSLVYNPGSIEWGPVLETTIKKQEIMYKVNHQGFFYILKSIRTLPKRIVCIAPPIYSRFWRGKGIYATTKLATSILVQSLSLEVPSDVGICCLWPATGIESHVTKVLGADLKLLRKATIMGDACDEIIKMNRNEMNGQCFIDQDILMKLGYIDFSSYQCVSGYEPPRMMPKEFPNLSVKEQDDRGPFAKL